MAGEQNTLRVWANARVVTMIGSDLGVIDHGAVVAAGERIVWVGDECDVPASSLQRAEIVDCGGRLLTPGFVDCHTHLVFAGDRADEFTMRLAGASYEEISREGGGIVSSVRALRAADDATLLATGLRRLDALLADGVTTVEVKSGYGLDVASERRSLQTARRFAAERRVTVQATCLAAHAIPPEWKTNRSGYVDLVVDELLPTLANEGLIDTVDVFCEEIAFSQAETERIFRAAKAFGLPVKLHADQRTDGGGAALSSEWGALSADHVEHTSEEGAAAMARAGSVAVLLPGAFHMLQETKRPPIAAFRRYGVPMAVATDANPGTSPLLSLRLAMNFAATMFGLTIPECLAGVTREAARALGMADGIGTIVPGKRADLAVWNAERSVELVYWLGLDLLQSRIYGGQA